MLTECVVNVSGLPERTQCRGYAPSWGIRQAVEVVKGRHPRRRVTPQACALRVTVPLPRHGPYGQARAGGGAGPRAPGGRRRSCALRSRSTAVEGRGACGPPRRGCSRPDGDPSSTPSGPPARCGAPASTRPPAATLGTRPVGRHLRDLPGPGEALVAAPGPRSVASSARSRGASTAPACSWARAVATPAASRPSPRGRPRALDTRARRAWASLAHAPSPRSHVTVSAASPTRTPRQQPPPTAAGRSLRLLRAPGPLLIGPQSAGHLGRLWHGGADSAGRPQARPARYQHRASRPKTEARASNGPPPCRR